MQPIVFIRYEAARTPDSVLSVSLIVKQTHMNEPYSLPTTEQLLLTERKQPIHHVPVNHRQQSNIKAINIKCYEDDQR